MPSPRYWREIPGRYRLEASRCGACSTVTYPRRHVCPECRGREETAIELTPRGRIVGFTVVRVAPADFAQQAPYAVALVETPERVRLMAQVAEADLDRLSAGTEVTLEFRRIRAEGHSGILCYGHKAVPCEA